MDSDSPVLPIAINTIPDRLVLYDGVCGMCNWSVQFALDIDKQGVFRFAPLQGETAAALRAVHPEIPENLDTVVFIDRGHVWLWSDAALEAARCLPYPWRLLSAARWIPRPVRDVLYKLIAKYRYRMFGRHDTCRIPAPGQRQRFLP